jgi:hypothetical protein
MQQFIGHPAGTLLDHFGLRREDLDLHEEPPLMLSSFSFQTKVAGEARWFRVDLPLKEELLSYDYSWSFEAIREAKVIRIREGQTSLCIPVLRKFE